MEPGWVPTKMGGPNASDPLDWGHLTQVWLADSEKPEAKVTGRYFFHLQKRESAGATHDAALQEHLITAVPACRTSLPAA